MSTLTVKKKGSLLACVPPLATLLGTTPAALYERQRALAAAGLLAQKQGKGPGSGVRADPRGVALLVLAMLVSDSQDVGERTREIADAVSKPADIITKKKSFLDAFAALLDSRELAEKCKSVTVFRSSIHAVIAWPYATTHFKGAPYTSSPIEKSNVIRKKLIQRIAALTTTWCSEEQDRKQSDREQPRLAPKRRYP